jgi:DNA-binding transcriptional MerR regulator
MAMELTQSLEKTFSMEEMEQLTGLARRTIRYYIEFGLLPGPIGETRAAYYTWKHLRQLLEIRRLTEEGLSLERVRQRLANPYAPGAAGALPAAPSIEVRSHLRLAPGVEIVIEPGAAQLTPEQLRRFMRETLDVLARVRHSQEPQP